jgi:hypothetical protein
MSIVREPGWQERPGMGVDALMLAAVVLLGASVIFALGLVADRPITFPDETVYGDLARNLAAGRGFEVSGLPFSPWTYGPIYPVLLALLFWIAPTTHEAYIAARALNSLMFASAAVPIWLIARRLLTRRAALVVAASGVAVPASVYSTKLLTESLAYPVVLWVVLAVLGVLAQPRRHRQLLLLALLVVVPLARFELIALFPAALVACLICIPGTLKGRLICLRPLLAGGLITGICIATLLAVARTSGWAIESHGLSAGHTSIPRFGATFAGMIGALDLYAGIVPFGLLVSLLIGLRSTSSSRAWAHGETGALAIITGLIAITLAVIASLYLSGLPGNYRAVTPFDRYLFYVVPLLLIIFARWIEHGAPRSPDMRFVVPIAGALPVVVGATQVHGEGLVATVSGLSLLPWVLVRAILTGPWWLGLLALYCCLCAWLGMKARVEKRWFVKSALLLSVVTLCAFGYAALGSAHARATTPPGGWLDARTEGEVVAVWVTRPTPRESFALWEVNAMNRNLSRVYYVRHADKFGPETKVDEGSRGQLLDHGEPILARYALTSLRTPVLGRLIAQDSGLALYRVRAPLRIIPITASSVERTSTLVSNPAR